MGITEELNNYVDERMAKGYTDEMIVNDFTHENKEVERMVRNLIATAVLLRKNKTARDKVHKIIEKHKEVKHGTDEI